ncbi:phosphatase PAP2 family protein [Paenibacillus sp. LMG 31456]|uniref:Phosphatase PAP2 family protein n=2 Tax=Paenibacillus foliorum TaxID=2654974 RepID=A0A972GTR8_9BACL|nr:phosphatase PAP2 family protein [Paenibacillus foliorum]
MAMFIQKTTIDNFDRSIIQFVQNLEAPLLTNIMKFFSFIGSGNVVAILVIIIAVYLYKGLGHRRELVLFIGVNIGSGLLNKALKTVFQRARPTIHQIVEEAGYSFPSGHSMGAFTLYGVTAFLLWRHTSPAINRVVLIIISSLMIVAIGISRIYLGVHYPSDVVGGYLASGFWLAISIWFFQRFGQSKQPSKE